MTVPVRRVTWARTVRIIRSIHPPIDLFEDIADPADWEALASAEAKFNPRLRDSIGDLSKVPPARRVAGPGASWVMAPFVHCSTLRPGRFSDGSFGLYYAGDRTEVAIAETIHHHARFMRATAEPPGWTAQFRELIGAVDTDLDDVTGRADLLHPSDYAASHTFGAERRAAGSNGITWPSVRYPGGQCIAVFWPDVIPVPVQGAHFAYHWNGSTVDYVKKLDSGEVWRVTGQEGV
ncbi:MULTISPECIES: RES family NAD+ phosphorylase [unclassified Azospirillum]|uniref:RES family NAD+ phosphorylase n=1 Tax=unclassified Azospirillum TaxID=2630922 RepID=UPI000B682148|nr:MULTISPECIES: RES family NAD+ phosphorylase [unclassified Azospirillum]SNS50269.1 RES domain-containing protein [Azospirillum sp. RU38E]SNS71500.1 RES domain-containing protein [Azospirillum sp. RU37A]